MHFGADGEIVIWASECWYGATRDMVASTAKARRRMRGDTGFLIDLDVQFVHKFTLLESDVN